MTEALRQPRRTRLVSFLGTGRYELTRHRFADDTIGPETPYICRALGGHVQADEIDVVATAEAKQAHATRLQEALRDGNLPAPNFHLIPFGKDKAELWQQFELVKNLLRPPAGTEIVFDVTHAFRSQPFFAAAIASFVRTVGRDPAPLSICYAAFEARAEGITPVWDLTPFIELVDWTQDMMMFLRTGRAAGVAEPTIAFDAKLRRDSKGSMRPDLDKLGKALRQFGGNLETIRTGDLLLGKQGSAAHLATALEEARQNVAALPPLADVLDRLQADMLEPLSGAKGHLANDAGHRALAGLARLYLNMGRWAEAAAIVREGWITRYATPAGALGERNTHNASRPAADENARHSAETRWIDQEKNTARTIGNIRNDIEHAGFNWQPGAAADLQSGLCKLIQEFARLSGVAPSAGHPAVFVNLSNHPSERWGEAQQAAARQFAATICDFPFPAVPPEASIDQIAELAERTVEQLREAHPGMTHAMVQGEFTLVNALVRKLQQRGIVCLSATARRDVIAADGDIKTTRFEFVRFREYL